MSDGAGLRPDDGRERPEQSEPDEDQILGTDPDAWVSGSEPFAGGETLDVVGEIDITDLGAPTLSAALEALLLVKG